ncbi:hypothetical protein [Flavobacterium chungangense]|uniref:DUF4374 domain-containing protein n=1 Tax=Flavobacterium chungangense TaxID=554283 RepID=A0A6V6YYF5_9FLAO|nr:hypothetical protein [Flavobacterium chungangense]CAD0003702.1 hypothetical protein FLACHUCJ7_01569 [Flavobacterium chungangense]
MKKTILKFSIACLASLILFSACSKDDDQATTADTSNFVVVSALITSPYSGYITSFGSTMPSGTISNVKGTSKQAQWLVGIRQFGKYIYRFHNASGERGITKYSVDATTQTFKEEGYIATDKSIFGSGQHVIVNETTGFYFDPALGLLKIQKFNPTTMQRTGEFDFTAKLQDATKEFVSLGQTMMMVKEGKLYANIHYGTTARKGYLDSKDGIIRLAVIDIATGNLDKTITFDTGNKIVQTGWFFENPMWDLGDDGHLYFCDMAGIGSGGSSLHRIKKGETEIDANWIVKMDDITKNGFFHNILVRNGKIYTRIPNEGIKPDFSNIGGEIWEYSTIDVNTKTVQKITGTPIVSFNGNANAIVEIDKQIYLMVENKTQKINGFFKVNGTTATQSFQVSEGGSICGFAKL